MPSAEGSVPNTVAVTKNVSSTIHNDWAQN